MFERERSGRRKYAARLDARLRRCASLSDSGVALLVVAITVAGLALRLPSFGDSLFGDELSTYWVVTGHRLGRVLHLVSGHSGELSPPLFFVFAWVSEKLFGASAESLKLVSLLAGTATIPLTYRLGRLTVSVRAGLVAAALVALSPFMIFYSTEARPYALLVLLCLLSTLALLQATRTGTRGWWIAYAACSCAAVYTHFTAVFVLVAQFAWAFVTQSKARRALLTANAAALIGFLPYVPSLIRIERDPWVAIYGAINPVNLHDIRIDIEHLIGHPFRALATVPGTVGIWLALAGLAIAALGAIATLAQVWTRTRGAHPRARLSALPRVPPELWLVLVLALAAPVLNALYSSVRTSVWGARNLITSWPGLAVLVAALLTYTRARWLAVPAVGLVIAAYAIGGTEMQEASSERPDYKSAAAYIDRISAGRAPAVELTAPTPGPPTELEAALAFDGLAARYPVVRLGLPPLGEMVRAFPHPATSPPPPQSGEVVARQAAALAGQGLLFVVGPTSLPMGRLESLRRLHYHGQRGELQLFVSFLGALPARYRPVTARTFPGFFPVTVYVFRG